MTAPDERARRFRAAYGEQRAAEGRGSSELTVLPYVTKGVLARQWQVRARTFDRFVEQVLRPLAAEAARPLRVADLGAGNGWLCYRLALLGHQGLAIDVRTDAVDGLGAAAGYAQYLPDMFVRVASSFEELPLTAHSCDLAVFNASLHYALDLTTAVAEAARVVRSHGRIAILDSPFYADEAQGLAMAEEKRQRAAQFFGERARDLMALPLVEFLTRERLHDASSALGLQWRHVRVRYPFWYQARPLLARLLRQRAPSRFDLWEARVP